MKKTTTTLAILCASATLSQAAVIAWGSATSVTTGAGNSSDVSTNGSLHHAINGAQAEYTGAATTTVNGQLFTTVKGGGNTEFDTWASGNSGDASYDTLLSSVNFNLGGPSTSLSLGDASALGGAALTDGQQYEIQIWFADDRTDQNARVMTFNDGSGNSINLNDQYVIGTFTASGTTQALGAVANSFGQAHINALQIRAIPEPSSTALLGLGCLALILRRRR